MTKSVPEPSRSTLPIPEQIKPQLTTYDAKDPSTSFPPITPLRPPADAPNVLVILLDDTGFGASSAFGGPVNTPTFERLADGRTALLPLSHDGAVLSDESRLAFRPQPSLGWHGRDHGDRDVRARLQLAAPELDVRRWLRRSR